MSESKMEFPQRWDKRRFRSKIPLNGLTQEDKTLLRRYGWWMAALAKQKIEPSDREESHFVQSAIGLARARTGPERLWRKYLRVVGQEQQKATKDRIMTLVREGQLSKYQLNDVRDRATKLGLSSRELALIATRIRQLDLSDSPEWIQPNRRRQLERALVVFSTVEGQD